MTNLFKKISLLITLSLPLLTHAQAEKDIKAIQSLCGCFKVKFDFAETFSPDTSYSLKDRYSTGAIEYIFTDEQTSDKLVLQHLLVIDDSTVIKHWRQDWEYQQNKLFSYEGHRKWATKLMTEKEVRNTWTQKVYEVNDAPRYAATAHWIHSSQNPYWEAVANAPLPRREYTKRSDYHILLRQNRHEISAFGHIHDQDNEKIILAADGSKSLLVREKGYVTYTRLPDSECSLAIEYWKKNQRFWRISRLIWDEILAESKMIEMSFKVNGKMFHESLAEFMKNAPEDDITLKEELRKLIKSYLTISEKI